MSFSSQMKLGKRTNERWIGERMLNQKKFLLKRVKKDTLQCEASPPYENGWANLETYARIKEANS